MNTLIRVYRYSVYMYHTVIRISEYYVQVSLVFLFYLFLFNQTQ